MQITIVYRNTGNYNSLLARCKDTATDGRGFILPLGDEQIAHTLELIANGKRNDVDSYISQTFAELLK